MLCVVESQLSQKTGNTRRLRELHVWCVKQYVVTLIAAQRREQAQEFLAQARWLYDDVTALEDLQAFLTGNVSALRLNAVNDARGYTRLMLLTLYRRHAMHADASEMLSMWLPQTRYSSPPPLSHV